jgi:iron complex transport system ATP-binding protein
MTVPAPPLIELDRASVQRGGQRALDEVSLILESGRHAALLGPNGCGKSSLVKLIARELHPLQTADDHVPVRVLGQARWDVFALRRRLGIVSADLHHDLVAQPGLCALDAVLAGFFASRVLPPGAAVPASMRHQAAAALDQVGAAHLAPRRLAELSLGEARRVLIARALAHSPQALLLDEPTTGLDVVARERVLGLLRALARQGITLVLTTHHVEELVPEIERVVLLRAGKVFADGRPEGVLTSATLSALYGIGLHSVNQGGRWRLALETPAPASAAATRGTP